MANPLEQFGVSDAELAAAIADDARVDAGVNDKMQEVVDYWKSIAPVDSGAYAASVKVIKKSKRGKGKVAATDFKAHWIEFGTGEPGPTKAFGTGEQVARHFGGTLDEGGVSV